MYFLLKGIQSGVPRVKAFSYARGKGEADVNHHVIAFLRFRNKIEASLSSDFADLNAARATPLFSSMDATLPGIARHILVFFSGKS